MKHDQPAILVTGVGAIIGYGIIHSLRRLPDPPRIIGMDIYPDAVGQQWCDEFVCSVPAAAADYVDFIRRTVSSLGINLIIPGIEQDVASLSLQREALADCGAVLALNTAELIETTGDKWSTHLALTAAGRKTIRTRIDGEFDELCAELGRPFLLKPRRSYASKGICRISSAAGLRFWREELGNDFMVQQIVGSNDDEYTVGTFGFGDGTISQSIAFRRTLSGEGATAKAWVVSEPQLDATVSQLATIFRPLGPTNFQFRKHHDEFLLLEVNPRISSSTSLRTAFGYNEAAMCIDFYLHGKKPEPVRIRRGHALRYIEDLVSYDSDHS